MEVVEASASFMEAVEASMEVVEAPPRHHGSIPQTSTEIVERWPKLNIPLLRWKHVLLPRKLPPLQWKLTRVSMEVDSQCSCGSDI